MQVLLRANASNVIKIIIQPVRVLVPDRLFAYNGIMFKKICDFLKFNNSNVSVTKALRYSVIVILSFFVIAFLAALRFTMARTQKDYEARQSETIITNITGSIEANLDNYKDISKLLLLDDMAVKYLRAISADAGLTNDARFGVLDVVNVCRNLDSVVLIRNNHQYMNTGRGQYSVNVDLDNFAEWEELILASRGGAVTQINGGGIIFRNDGRQMISISRAFFDINSQKHLGYMIINFTTGMLDRVITSQKSDRVCILTDEGTYLAGNKDLIPYTCDEFKTSSIVHKDFGGIFSKKVISGTTMKDAPLMVICETNGGSSMIPGEVILSFGILLIAFLASVFLATKFIIRNFTTPIVNLSDAMEKTKESGWLEKVNVDIPNNEIGTLADSYNSMIDYLNNLFLQLIENEKEIQRAEISVLHEQIKPHFLYNSLECINCMAMDEGAPNVQKAIATLGNFYRNSLSRGDREIPLSREIRIIQDYLYLQRLRYGDVLVDEYHLDERTLDLPVPKLVLQPLVENSIYHGIRLKGEEGMISITSHLEDDGLHLWVYDTGVGMPEDVIENVLSTQKNEPQTSSEALSGFGLKGTVQRIRYYSGSDDSVRIRSEIGEFTEIEIVIPVTEKEL